MKNEDRIVELLAEMAIKQDSVVEELRNVKSEIVKLNLQTAENSRAIFKLADKVEQIADLESRVTKLEKVVYK
ncbi:MAG: hypothetical protein KF775_12495 [Cyclobacteriaceae bacterium]|nr:hypothetical protein [Cyclobacteriaceae bacterium]